MRRSLLTLSISAALCSPVMAQTNQTSAVADASVPVTYVGTNGRISLGIDNHGDVQGEGLGIFDYTGEHAWLGGLWLGQGGAGGVQLDYHWLWAGKSRQDTIDHPDDVAVAKAFIAADQNAWHDRKLTLGAGYEKHDFFVDGYLMGALTGRRFVDSMTDIETTTLTGSDATGPYTQTQTITTLTDFFERPYNYGAGVHIGKYFDDPLVRLRAGLDYEVGHNDADQLTVSAGVDKYLRNTGWSFSLEGEHLRKSGPFEMDRSDDRGWFLVRYEFGQSFRAREPYTMVQVEKPANKSATAPAAAQVMRNDVRLDGDAFFNFDKANLLPETARGVDELIAKLKSGARASKVSVIGHTCNIGSASYNQKLSERRAQAVRDYLIKQGIPADEIEARGEGLRNPKYPNDTAANRRKNRRVDIEFLTVEETTTTAAPLAPAAQPGVEWIKQPVAMPAAWIERALRNPAEHKRTVDVYRIEEQSSTTTLGSRVHINRPPVALDDTATVAGNSSANPISVLANDSDPDGDALSITTTSAAAHGTVVIAGTLVNYTPTIGYVGTDTFTYSISDSHGGTASANVTVTITSAAAANHPPLAQNDAASTSGTTPVNVTVLANDSDPDGDAIHVTSVAAPAHGTATVNSDGSVRYVANAGFAGMESFNYTIADSNGATATAQITVTVAAAALNHPPIANNDEVSVIKGSAANLNVLANDSDPDGDPLTIISVTHTGPLTAEVSINPEGTVRYTHHHGTAGRDTFTYTISDGHGNTATATVVVNVFEIWGGG